ncbi:hypothetical protein Hanom_Chr02g00141721 [Helianthus anomalus]
MILLFKGQLTMFISTPTRLIIQGKINLLLCPFNLVFLVNRENMSLENSRAPPIHG